MRTGLASDFDLSSRAAPGRLECMTPEARADVGRALLDRGSGEPARVAAAALLVADER